MLRRDADAGIMHDNVDPGFTGLFTGRGGDGDGAVAGELGCIGKQVDDSLAQLGDVGIDLHGAGCMLDDAAIAILVELATADGQGIVDDVRQADPLQENVHLARSEEHTSELQSLMRISYAVFCLKKKQKKQYTTNTK